MKTVGYKAMNMDMTCRGYQFEVGKTYTIDNDKPLELCTDSGFHFCLNLEDVFHYYPCGDCRVFEIETNSEVFTDLNKSVTKSLTIKRELTREDLSNYTFESKIYSIYFNNYSDEELLKFKDDESILIREVTASKMGNLDLMFETFKDDVSWVVRKVVVERMEDLDLMFHTFKNDESRVIRRTVARRRNLIVNKIGNMGLIIGCKALYDKMKNKL